MGRKPLSNIGLNKKKEAKTGPQKDQFFTVFECQHFYDIIEASRMITGYVCFLENSPVCSALPQALSSRQHTTA